MRFKREAQAAGGAPAARWIEGGVDGGARVEVALQPGEGTLTFTPVKPRGYGDRAITIDVTVDVVPLTFWERYGFKIEVGAAVVLFLFILLGVVLILGGRDKGGSYAPLAPLVRERVREDKEAVGRRLL